MSGGWLAAQRTPGLTAFRSADPAVRALQGPNAIALSGAASDPLVLAALCDELDRHVRVWLDWVLCTPLLVHTEQTGAVSSRDRAVGAPCAITSVGQGRR